MTPGTGPAGLLWRRHINPWNWWTQAFCLALAVPGLWLHDAALLALALLGLGAGFLDLKLPPMRRLGLAWPENLTAWAIRHELLWLQRPWDRNKKIQAAAAALALPLLGLALWTQDIPALLAALGAGFLLGVARDNKRKGIDP